MKKLITSSLFLLAAASLALSGCAKGTGTDPKMATISITDRNGFSETISTIDRLERYENVNFLSCQPYERVMRVYQRDFQGNVRAELITYHNNGQPAQYVDIVNGRVCGNYYEWHSNGTMNIHARVVEGEPELSEAAQQTWVFDGTSYVWDDDGNLLAEIPYCKGVLEGDSVYYHPSGNIWKTVTFHKDLMEGDRIVYLDNGDILSLTCFKEGLPHGRAVRYWTPQQLASEEYYDNGYLQTGNYYQPSGALSSSIHYGEGYKSVFAKDYIAQHQQYAEGIPAGEIKVYSPEGFITQIYHVKNGMKHGEDIEYYPQSRGTIPKISTYWIEGQLQGMCKTWYPNGVQESQREMNNGSKQGVLSAWYRDGSLMMIEEYENNKLAKGQYFKKNDPVPTSRVVNGNGVVTLYDADGHYKAKATIKNGKPAL